MPEQDLTELSRQFEEEIRGIRSEGDLLRLKAAYLGKAGHLSLFLKGLRGLPLEARPLYGARANELKERIERECREFLARLARLKREREIQEGSVDVTLPGRLGGEGRLHPVTQVLYEVEEIFREIGFSVFEGPEIETDYYNFEALNIPKDHPARDMQDTFYLGGPASPRGQPLLLRTHTSPVQIHVMEKMRPPIRMIAPGVVYRRDSDISHTPMFHQVEGLVVGEGIRFSDLKGVVSWFLHRLFGEGLGLRFRPSYFPFTEPSAEIDIECVLCHGKGRIRGRSEKGCRLCQGGGWLEVIGCGLVHPAVFEKVGYERERYSGFAFGMGIERLALLKFGIPDIRLFFENDLRFLRQF